MAVHVPKNPWVMFILGVVFAYFVLPRLLGIGARTVGGKAGKVSA